MTKLSLRDLVASFGRLYPEIWQKCRGCLRSATPEFNSVFWSYSTIGRIDPTKSLTDKRILAEVAVADIIANVLPALNDHNFSFGKPVFMVKEEDVHVQIPVIPIVFSWDSWTTTGLENS